MSEALLDADDLAELREVFVEAMQIDGVSAGGDTWTPESVSGDGESSPVTIGQGTAITGYLYQQRQPSGRASGPGVIIGAAVWLVAVVSGTTPASGTVLTSASDGRRIRLGAPIPDPLYPTFLAEQL